MISTRPIALLFLAMVTFSGAACGGDPRGPAFSRMKAFRSDDIFEAEGMARLADAVAEGDVASIDAIVRSGADVNAAGKDGVPLLVWAIAKDSVAGFDALLDHGADLTAFVRDPALARRNESTERVIQLAVCAKNLGFLRSALRHGFDPDYVPDREVNESLLFDAVKHHAEESVDVLLDANANIDHTNAVGSTAIRFANNVCDYKMVAHLLNRGIDPTIKDRWGLDLVADIKDRGENGVKEQQKPYFKQVVAELERRGLLTQQDILDATTRRLERKRSGQKTTIVHPRDSATGRAIDGMGKPGKEVKDP